MGHEKICFMLLACLAAMIWATPVAAMTVAVGSATGAPGDIVEIPITVEGAKNLGSMDILITYDPAVLSVDSVDSGALNTGLLSVNKDTAGTVSIGIVDANGINGEGAIAVIKFKVTGGNGATSALAISNILAYDVKTHVDIQTTTSGGTFTVNQPQQGGQKSNVTPGFETAAGVLAVALLVVIRKVR
jgi:hypothetical protein